MSWKDFIHAHMAVLVVTDFFTVEVLSQLPVSDGDPEPRFFEVTPALRESGQTSASVALTDWYKLVRRVAQTAQIVTEAVFRAENDHLDRGEPLIECARNLRIALTLVVTQNERNPVTLWQAIELLPQLALCFIAQDLRERRRSQIVRDCAKIFSREGRVFLALPPTQLVDAVVACHLTEPRAQRVCFIFFVEDRVQFQEDFCCGILCISRLAKEAATNLQDVAIVRRVNGTQNFGGALQSVVHGVAQPGFFRED